MVQTTCITLQTVIEMPGAGEVAVEIGDSHLQVSLAGNEKNLTLLVAKLKASGATLIWCNTTPAPDGSAGRIASDEVKYNKAAVRVMTAAGIPSDDLCSHARAKLKEMQLPANVHYTSAGYKYLAQRVEGDLHDTLAFCIREILRNAVEHSHTEKVRFAAQYWPTLDRVEFAVLDHSRGIRAALGPNPHVNPKNDREALNLALMPGVSGTSLSIT